MFDLRVNGYECVFEVRLETEPGEGWTCRQSIAVCETLEHLNQVIHETTVPEYWRLVIDLQEKYPDPYPEDEE